MSGVLGGNRGIIGGKTVGVFLKSQDKFGHSGGELSGSWIYRVKAVLPLLDAELL